MGKLTIRGKTALIATAFAGLTGCIFSSGAPTSTMPTAELGVHETVGAGARALLPILDRKAGPEENVFFSPLSIDYAFGVVALGARGETARQLAKFLPPPSGLDAFTHNRNDVELRIANRLWVEKKFEPAKAYIAAAKSRYQSGIEQIDKTKPEASVDRINNWSNDATNGLIPQVVNSDDIKSMTAIIITNAIYFDGEWAGKFSKIREEPFLFGNGEDKPFAMMQKKQELPLVERNDWRAVRLPYSDPRYAMDILIPKKREIIAAVPSLAFIGEMSDRLDDAKPKLVDLKLPQFEVDTDIELVEPLKELGLTAPFSMEEANFSGMVVGNQDRLSIGGAKQLAKVQVFNTGTRATAVTVVSVVVITGSNRKEQEGIPFIVDHPFVIVLRDLERDAILFLGRIADPQPFEADPAVKE